jgi:hypothetical protein
MKAMRAVLPYFSVMVLLAFATVFASAGDTDCTTAASSCGFGALVTTVNTTLTGNGHSVPVEEQVFQNGSVYTYVFQITDGNTHPLDYANVFTLASGFGDNFNCGNGSCLNFGVVDGGITHASVVDDTGFSFNQLSLTVGFGVLHNTQNFTFYVQGGAPVSGTLNSGDGGSTTNNANVLAAASEPGVVTLLGSTLLLLFGIPVIRRFQPRAV